MKNCGHISPQLFVTFCIRLAVLNMFALLRTICIRVISKLLYTQSQDLQYWRNKNKHALNAAKVVLPFPLPAPAAAVMKVAACACMRAQSLRLSVCPSLNEGGGCKAATLTFISVWRTGGRWHFGMLARPALPRGPLKHRLCHHLTGGCERRRDETGPAESEKEKGGRKKKEKVEERSVSHELSRGLGE